MVKNLIVPLNLSQLTNADAYQLVNRFLTQLDSQNQTLGDDAVILDLIVAIRKGLPKLQEANHQTTSSTDTKKIAELDKARDLSYQFLLDSHHLHSYDLEADKLAAYEQLNSLFNQYKDVKRLSYERETEALNNLLGKLKQSPYKEAVASLSLSSAIKRLEKSQADFEQVFSKRASDKSQQISYDGKALKRDLLHQFDLLGKYLAIRVEVRKEELPTALLAIYNSVRKEWKKTIRTKTSKAEG